ncbi:MAG: ABC transporter ATP-binding protein/permease [Defluviitaleaceae bacterium]|nr:ABC transporter ATP-binding protein/permease [Defluviitaleaceae bacterium]MCL2275710.1 ABC transporter ATP-binding protein/permease [Defluviitaleaceae bacterium]
MNAFTRTFSYMKPHRMRYFGASALSALELAVLFSVPFVNRMLVEMFTQNGGDTVRNIASILVALLALTPFIAIGRYWQERYAQGLSNSLKKSLFAHIQRLPLAVLNQRQSGDYLLRVSNDADRAGSMFSGFIVLSLLRFLVVTAVTMVLLILTDWRIALLALVYNLVCFGLSLLVNPYVNKLERGARQEISASANVVLETLRAIPIVRVFALASTLGERYQRRCEAVRQTRVKFRTANGWAYGVMDIFSFSAQAVGFIAAIFLLTRGEMTLASAVYAASLMALASNAMLQLSTFILWVQPPLVAAGRIFEILDRPAEAGALLRTPLDTAHPTAIEIGNLSFTYPDGTNALQNISVTIKNGERIALVGESGGGKSTLAQVIAALYTPTQGEIKYFGESNLTPEQVRSYIAYVPQNPVLFEGTAYENIALGNPAASPAQIKKAAQDAGVEGEILHNPVGERGMSLSGGQRQRVAIARALLKDAPILILDEATGALDSETEAQIQLSLEKLTQNRTTITIAHRPASIQSADRVVRLEKGSHF